MLSRKFLPLLFLFSLGYGQNWEINNQKLVIEHKNEIYYSRQAKKEHLTAYYVYKMNNDEVEIIGDNQYELEDYIALSLASHYNLNKGDILLRVNKDMEIFKQSNKNFMFGSILNQAVEELSKIDAILLLNLGNKKFSLKKEIQKKYSEQFKEFSKEFLRDVIEDKDNIKNLDYLVKKLEYKIFNSSVVKSQENIENLEIAKKILMSSRVLSTDEISSAEKLISEGTSKGYSISAFQDEYIRNLDKIGYQLTQVGSSMLKEVPAGQKIYSYLKKKKINGIEEINSEALNKSLKKMNDVYNRIAFSMTAYKKNFDPSLKNSNSNQLVDYLKGIKELLSNLSLIKGEDAVSIYTNPKSIGDYSVKIFEDENSVTFDIDAGAETLAFGWFDVGLDLKNIKQDLRINLESTVRNSNPVIFYRIGITDGRYPSDNPGVNSYAGYSVGKDNPNFNTISWNIMLNKNGKLEIRKDEVLGYSINQNFYNFDINSLNKWFLRVIVYTKSFEESSGQVNFSNLKIRMY